MPEWFSDEEMDRIVRFAKSPGYSRDPTMLLPEDQDTEEQRTKESRAEENSE